MSSPPLEVTVNFRIERELHNRLDSLPWGIKASLLRKMYELVADAYDKDGKIIIGTILDDKMELRLKREEIHVETG